MKWLRHWLLSTRRYFHNHLLWFRMGWPFWLIVGVFFILFVAPNHSTALGPTTEGRIRFAGMFFQVIGFFVALLGVNDTLRNLGLGSIPSRVWNYFRDFPLFQGHKPTVIKAQGISVATSVGKALATSRIRADASVDEKIEFLQRQVESIQKNIFDESVKREKAVEELQKLVKEKFDSLAEEVEKLRNDSVKKIEGDARLEALGVLLFLVGIVLSTASTEIHGLL